MRGCFGAFALLMAMVARAEPVAPEPAPFEFPARREGSAVRLLGEPPGAAERAARVLTSALAGGATVAAATVGLQQLLPRDQTLLVSALTPAIAGLGVSASSWLLGGHGGVGWVQLAAAMPYLVYAVLLATTRLQPGIEPALLVSEVLTAVAVSELTSWINDRELDRDDELSLLNGGAGPPVVARRKQRGLLWGALAVEWAAATAGIGLGALGGWAALKVAPNLCVADCGTPSAVVGSPVTIYLGAALAAVLLNAAGGWWCGWGTSWAATIGTVVGELVTFALVPLLGPWALIAIPFFAVAGYEVSSYLTERGGAFSLPGLPEGLAR